MCQEDRKILAKNIKKYRECKGLTREQLSLMLGLDNSYISKLENCKINITIDVISNIANKLNIKIIKIKIIKNIKHYINPTIYFSMLFNNLYCGPINV